MKGLIAGFSLLVSLGAFAQFGNNCSYQLLDEYNREIMTVDDYTCNDARLKCEQERDYQVYNNLIRQGTCVQVGGYNGGGFPGGGYPGGNGGINYSQCEVSLQNSIGMTYQVFYGNNCSQALATCDQARIVRQTPYEALFCRMTSGSGNDGGYNGGGYPGGYGQSVQCIFSLKDVRTQREVNQFMQTGVNQQQACELAYNQCQAQARAYNGYNGIQNYVCSKRAVNNGGGYNGGGYNGGNQGQYMSQTCTIAIVDTRGSVLDRTMASASGYGQLQARQLACSQAQTQCRNIIASRTVPNRPSPYFGARCIEQ